MSKFTIKARVRDAAVLEAEGYKRIRFMPSEAGDLAGLAKAIAKKGVALGSTKHSKEAFVEHNGQRYSREMSEAQLAAIAAFNGEGWQLVSVECRFDAKSGDVQRFNPAFEAVVDGARIRIVLGEESLFGAAKANLVSKIIYVEGFSARGIGGPAGDQSKKGAIAAFVRYQARKHGLV